MNNFYGWATSRYIPYGRYKQLKNAANFDVSSISGKIPIGYILQVDLEYLDELHVFHNDYPLAPENLAIPYDMLSDYCNKVADEYEVVDVKKLIQTLGNKTNHLVNCKNLQLYLSLAMKLTKIHRVLKIKQSDWMKKYIHFNTEE